MRKIIVLVLVSCGLFSCKQENTCAVCLNGKCFDIEAFKDGIENAVKGKTVGYAYSIFCDGEYYTSGAGGLSSTNAETGGPIDMGTEAPVNVASVSKTFTAMAMLKLLKAKNIPITEKISTHLPSGWAKGVNISSISFQDLLTHRSGFRSDTLDPTNNGSPLDYATLKMVVANGVRAVDYGVPSYQNLNFCLMRILIPYINGHAYAGTDAADATQTSQEYVDYVKAKVMTPSGAFNTDVKSITSPPPHLYPFPDDAELGVDAGDWTAIAGGGGWNICVNDAARVMSRLMFTENILDANTRNDMLNNSLGTYIWDTPYGKAYNHNGGISYANSSGSNVGSMSCYYIYPNGVIAFLHFNSAPPPKWINTILEDEWTNAWK